MRIQKHVGIYGGSFDPIHFGHLNTAIEIMEYHGLDEVWFCPAQINPHKLDTVSIAAHHRLKMLEFALDSIPYFGIIANELNRPGPSYTIDTLRELVEEQKYAPDPSKFFLILGEDSLPGFFRWKDPLEIIKLAPPLVAKRFISREEIDLIGDPDVCEALKKGLTPTHIMEVSATRIRERVRRGLYIGHLVPAKVVDYIYQNHLYSLDSNLK
ncbi:MAG: nicotinate (nicotinamide) nucleotide adenylyltransferase [Chlamydiales bacterium]|nr:nicotinate (nicotinamide) nucleotide adenylyltransferase [Chlamydiales bacterium]